MRVETRSKAFTHVLRAPPPCGRVQPSGKLEASQHVYFPLILPPIDLHLMMGFYCGQWEGGESVGTLFDRQRPDHTKVQICKNYFND